MGETVGIEVGGLQLGSGVGSIEGVEHTGSVSNCTSPPVKGGLVKHAGKQEKELRLIVNWNMPRWRLHSEEGKAPVNEFLSTAKVFRPVSKPSDEGREPTIEFVPTLKCVSAVRFPIEAGRVPVRWLQHSCNVFNAVREPNELGRVPNELKRILRLVSPSSPLEMPEVCPRVPNYIDTDRLHAAPHPPFRT